MLACRQTGAGIAHLIEVILALPGAEIELPRPGYGLRQIRYIGRNIIDYPLYPVARRVVRCFTDDGKRLCTCRGIFPL